MTTTAEKDAGTGATSGTPAWQNPGNITSEDGSNADISSLNFPPSTVSAELRATNFGFAAAGVGVADTIDGVEMRFKRNAQRTQQNDDTIKLFWSGSVQGSDQSLAPDWPSSPAPPAFASYGGAADTWGASPTATDVRSSGFGCSIKVKNNRGVGGSQVLVDVVKMTVHYTQVAVGPQFFAQVIGVLPVFLQGLVLPLFCRRRSVTCTAQLVECYE